MASWTPFTRNELQPTAPDQNELIARIHNDALDTPTMLRGRLGTSASKHTPRVHVDSSSSDSDFPPSKASGARPSHSRSKSNPFPSFLGGRKKRATSRAVVEPGQSDDDAAINAGGRAHIRGGGSGCKDFVMGNCMTCASLVRWPKELKVFKCTICMTINDLVPLESDAQADVGQRPVTSNGSSVSRKPTSGRVQPISLEHTKHLVRQCLRTYISRRLRGVISDDALGPRARNGSHFDQGGVLSDRSVLQRGRQGQGWGEKAQHTEQNGEKPNPLPSLASSLHAARPYSQGPVLHVPPRSRHRDASADRPDDPKRIFKPLEEYIIECFSRFECINSSFITSRSRSAPRSGSEPRRNPNFARDARPSALLAEPAREVEQPDAAVFDVDPKLLLLGDFAENGTWWTGGQEGVLAGKTTSKTDENSHQPFVLSKSPQLNWNDIKEWYLAVNNAAENWFTIYNELTKPDSGVLSERGLQELEQDLLKGQIHCQRVLLKSIEVLLKRPGRPLSKPTDLRFLLIILENPQLSPDAGGFCGLLQPDRERPGAVNVSMTQRRISDSGPLSGRHSGIIKRIVGLLSNSSIDCHNQVISWLGRYHASRFTRVKELVSGFLTYRMIRQSEKNQDKHLVDVTAGLIPQMRIGRSGASLHDEIGLSRSSRTSKEAKKLISYTDDWQIKAASRVLALVFAANNLSASRRGGDLASAPSGSGVRDCPHTLPASDFYNSMIDYADLVGDFESWESKRSKFSFCQYPFLLSIWAKTQILEYDTRRQMQSKARDAFFDSIMTRRNINQYLLLDVRRECLVDDSLQSVSEVIGSGGEDLKKGLRISFRGEEGIDAGGLRKEWFLLLVREVFNPDHGMFVYDEDSRYCYFNPNSFEASDQFFLVGVVMGLAIYNSTILDVALPPFAFRKLLASAPNPAGAVSAHQRPRVKYALEDLAEYQPRLASGLRQLLQFEGDVLETFSLDFVVDTDRYGARVQVPLCPGGESKPVTNANRREYVDLYIRHVLDGAVKRQFEPFKRGFYTVCGGNAFSLFRPEEIELLVRGSDEPLDIASLRAVAEYDHWGCGQPDGVEPVVGWFWETIERAASQDQRKMLLFITGSDRIPAMGAASLTIKISCLGEDCGRFPIARTCFNLLSLWRYGSREKLETMLWRAVHESEGFGLK